MMYYTSELPPAVEDLVAETANVPQVLDDLRTALDAEVERARAVEERAIDAVERAAEAVERAASAAGETEGLDSELSDLRAELEALRGTHRALVETLERSVTDVDAVRKKTRGALRTVLHSLRRREDRNPMFSFTASGPTEFPTTDETEAIDMKNRLDLANLDVKFRWVPFSRRRAVRNRA